MSASPPYSKTEIERRWLVATDANFDGMSAREREIEDHYVTDTRLRVRKVTESGRLPIYKLGKKYEPEVSGTHQVVSTYLSEPEYQALARLPARVARKKRISVLGGALDVYEYPNPGLRIFEIEFESAAAAAAYQPPPSIGHEVTNEPGYSGHALAGAV